MDDELKKRIEALENRLDELERATDLQSPANQGVLNRNRFIVVGPEDATTVAGGSIPCNIDGVIKNVLVT